MMDAIARTWKRIPRTIRLCINLLGITACLIALYTYFGAPTFSVEKDFRRMEKAHMVGPSEILTTVRLEAGFDSYQNMIVADDGDGVIFYCYDHVEFEEPALVYRKKTGDLTVLGAPYPQEARSRTIRCQYPIFLFDDYPDAVRAEMDITLSAQYFGESFEQTYHLTANRVNEGYFQFILGISNRYGLGIEGYAVQMVTMFSGYDGKFYQDLSFPVMVKLYNEAGKLLCHRELAITTVMTQAHQERGE